MDKAVQNSPAWNKGLKLPVETLTPKEVNVLLSTPSRRAPTGLRNRALMAVMYRSGLRTEEALSLMPKDYDPDAGTIRVHKGKGSRYHGVKARTVGIDPGGAAIIDAWLHRRADLDIPRTVPLFCTLDGGPMSARYVRAMVARYATKAGIEKRVHPHGLRHTHASELAREGTPVNTVQAQLGHSNLATTSRYLAHISPAELVATIQRRDWVNAPS